MLMEDSSKPSKQFKNQEKRKKTNKKSKWLQKNKKNECFKCGQVEHFKKACPTIKTIEKVGQ